MKLYLAATEDLYRVKPERRVSLKLRNVLLSFNGHPGRLPRAYAASGPARSVCVDSGAHFFISAWFKHGKKPPPAEVEDFQQRLLNELRALGAPIAFAVEMDLQDLYGPRLVAEWRARIWRPFARELGTAACYVWHSTESEAVWDALVADPDVACLGMSGRVGTVIPLEQAKRMVLRAYAARKPVHGFAMLKDRILRHVPLATADSTSWASGALYGQVTRWDARRMKLTRASVGRKAQAADPAAVAGALAAHGGRVTAAELRGSDKHTPLAAIAALYQETADAYTQWEDHLTELWRARGVDWEQRLGPTW